MPSVRTKLGNLFAYIQMGKWQFRKRKELLKWRTDLFTSICDSGIVSSLDKSFKKLLQLFTSYLMHFQRPSHDKIDNNAIIVYVVECPLFSGTHKKHAILQ